MVQYNILSPENCEFIEQKATQRGDGIYQARGIMYRVKKGKVTHYACKGRLYLNGGFALVNLGECPKIESEARKHLKEIKD